MPGDGPSSTQPNDDEFEILERINNPENRSLVKRLYQNVANYCPQSTVEQVGVGVVGGWLTGYVCKKVGKVAATSLGSGLMLLRLADQYGYIKINWRKVEKDTKYIRNRVEDEVSRNRSQIQTVNDFLRQNTTITLSFSSGFLIGFTL